MFDFGVANTTDVDCEQQTPSVAVRLQIIVSYRNDNTAGKSMVVLGLHPSYEYLHIFVRYLKPEYLPRRRLGEDLNVATESAMPTS